MKTEKSKKTTAWMGRAIADRIGCSYSYAISVLKRGEGSSLIARKILILAEKIEGALNEEIIIKD